MIGLFSLATGAANRVAIAAYQGKQASLNLLWALVAGLKGKDWRELSEATKKRLRKEADD
jgi:hypothetical protein